MQRRDRRRNHHKVVLLGDSQVGKTTLIRYQFQGFDPTSPIPTIGCHCTDFVFMIDNKPLNMQVWDTAGQEMYRALVPVYLRDAEGAIIVYDIAEKNSFDALDYWMDLLFDTVSSATVVFLVANKLDLVNESAVKEEDGMAYAAAHKATFFKACATLGQGVDEIFQGMATEIVRQTKTETQPAVIVSPEKKECVC
jgi:small GTP-binding protein